MEGVLPSFDPEAAAQFEGQYRYVEAILEEMRAYADVQAIPFYILRLPDGLSIDDAEAERLAKLIGRAPQDYDFDLPNRKIGEITQRLGIASGTITAAMRAAPDPGAIYMENDTHWNPEGNQLAADAMLPLIREFLDQTAAQVAGSNPDLPDE